MVILGDLAWLIPDQRYDQRLDLVVEVVHPAVVARRADGAYRDICLGSGPHAVVRELVSYTRTAFAPLEPQVRRVSAAADGLAQPKRKDVLLRCGPATAEDARSVASACHR